MASPVGSNPASSQAPFFHMSRPPSPSLVPGLLNLEMVNEKLRQRTPTPATPTAERERSKARKLFDELVGLGGIPLRPWADHRLEHLSDAERGDDNGDRHIMRLYLEDSLYWQTQLKVWRRFTKRRGQDGEPDLRDLDWVEVVAAFITYLQGHLQRDMEDRARPGCEIWPDYSQMVFHRSFIDDLLESLPAAEALRRQLQSERGHETALREPPVTKEGLHEEYKLPRDRSWGAPDPSGPSNLTTFAQAG